MGNVPPAALRDQLGPILAQATGKIAVACHHLQTGERWALGDDVFPAASLIKVHLAIAAYQTAERCALDLEEAVAVPPLAGDDEAEFDNLGLAPAGTRFTWRKVLDRMLTESDNAATNLVIDRLGLGALDTLTERLGLTGTALRRHMLDVAAREAGRENTTTAADMERLLTALATGDLLSAGHTQELLGLLGQQRDRDKLASGLPRGATFAHKTGELPGHRHDAGLVDGRWVVVVLAEGGREADGLLARIAEVLAAHFRAAEHAFDRTAAWLADERARLIPDPRMARDTLEAAWEAGALVVRGVTTLEARFASLSTLPARIEARHLTGRPGVVKVPCLQLRGGPGHAHELVSQLRLGDPVTLLEEGPDWTFLRGPDGYLAYGKTNNLMPLAEWRPTHVVAKPIARAEAEDGRVFQLSAGTRLVATDRHDHYRLPDGAIAGLEARTITALDEAGDAEDLLTFSLRLLGLPYLWGGTTGWGIDCSGLVQLAHFVMGVQLPRDADQQQTATEPVETIDKLEPGDLVFFPGHVGLYLGDGAFIHASAQAGMVTINSFDRADPRFDDWLFENFSGGGRCPLRVGAAARHG